MEAVKIVGIKYCGGCNPQIDRSQVAKQIKVGLPEGFELSSGKSLRPWDIGILLCGCEVGCAKEADIISLARCWILVCGRMVDGVEVPGEKIAEAIVQKLSKIALAKSL